MKHLLFVLCILIPFTAVADELPERKPGLWEMTSKVNIMGRNVEQIIKQCVDEQTDKELLSMGKNSPVGTDCSAPTFEKVGDTYLSKMACKGKGMNVSTETVFRGDFDSKFTSESTITYDPPLPTGDAQKVTVNAKWIGDCGAGLSPGEILLPDGKKINLMELNK